jgi:hypothetical protein
MKAVLYILFFLCFAGGPSAFETAYHACVTGVRTGVWTGQNLCLDDLGSTGGSRRLSAHGLIYAGHVEWMWNHTVRGIRAGLISDVRWRSFASSAGSDWALGLGDWRLFVLYPFRKNVHAGAEVLVPTAPYADGLGEGRFVFSLVGAQVAGERFIFIERIFIPLKDPDGNTGEGGVSGEMTYKHFLDYMAGFFWTWPRRSEWTSIADSHSLGLSCGLGKTFRISDRTRLVLKAHGLTWGMDTPRFFGMTLGWEYQ